MVKLTKGAPKKGLCLRPSGSSSQTVYLLYTAKYALQSLLDNHKYYTSFNQFPRCTIMYTPLEKGGPVWKLRDVHCTCTDSSL